VKEREAGVEDHGVAHAAPGRAAAAHIPRRVRRSSVDRAAEVSGWSRAVMIKYSVLVRFFLEVKSVP
jgi:hypothetical protein